MTFSLVSTILPLLGFSPFLWHPLRFVPSYYRGLREDQDSLSLFLTLVVRSIPVSYSVLLLETFKEDKYLGWERWSLQVTLLSSTVIWVVNRFQEEKVQGHLCDYDLYGLRHPQNRTRSFFLGDDQLPEGKKYWRSKSVWVVSSHVTGINSVVWLWEEPGVVFYCRELWSAVYYDLFNDSRNTKAKGKMFTPIIITITNLNTVPDATVDRE